MKFAERLAAHITPEWNSQYIKYDELKEFLYYYEQNAPVNEEYALQRYFASADEEFFRICEKELAKINTFFAEKLAEAQRKFETLNNELNVTNELAFERKARMSSMNIDAIDEDEELLKENKILDDEEGMPPGLNRRGLTNKLKDANNEAQSFLRRVSEKNRMRQLKQKKYKKDNDLKLAFSEFYLSLILLQNYQNLNYDGFRKILKKHDKVFKTSRGSDWRIAHVETAPFHTIKKVDQFISEIENLFAEKFENGDKQRAMKRLRVPPFEEKQSTWTTFRLGFYLGMIFILFPALIFILIVFYMKYGEFTFNWKIAIKLYRSTFFIIIHLIFVGINSYGWSTSGVNHVLIFEIDPRNHLTYQQILEVGSFLGVFWFLNLLTFLLSSYYGIDYFFYPFVLVIFLVTYLINPIPKFQISSRSWLMKVLWRVFMAPFYHVDFAHFWLADQLTSFEFLFVDAQFIGCYYLLQAPWAPLKSYVGDSPCMPKDYRDLSSIFNIISILLLCYPSWLRFMQCLRRFRDTGNVFPHLANAVKYSTTFVDIATLALKYKFSSMYKNDWENPFHYLYLIAKLCGTSYKFFWDVKMDWGFFDKNAGENKFLREVIVYSSKNYYYFAIIQDFILRYIWLVRFYDVGLKGETYKDIVVTLLGFLEVFRRFVWNFFRLENEHLNNCGQFRAVRDISISPIQTTELSLVEKMMDDEDGVLNRNQTLNAHIKSNASNMTTIRKFTSKHVSLFEITKRFNNNNNNNAGNNGNNNGNTSNNPKPSSNLVHTNSTHQITNENLKV